PASVNSSGKNRNERGKPRRGAQGIAFRKLRRETIWVLVPAAHDPHPAGEGQCYTKAKPAPNARLLASSLQHRECSSRCGSRRLAQYEFCTDLVFPALRTGIAGEF